MAKHTSSASAEINAPAAQLYAILADYRDGHPRILPRPPFGDLHVEQGGVGKGTVIRFQMRMMGRTMDFHSTITEPEPGRLLVESDTNTGSVTSFLVEPRDGGNRAKVTISTTTNVRDGIFGRIEGWMTTRMLQPIYIKELAQLATVAAHDQVHNP